MMNILLKYKQDMSKKLLSLVFILFLLIPAGLFAQSRELVFNVSQIMVESRSNLIRLTWVDSPDARGPVYIYRSARPFTGSIPANIRPVTVRYGMQYYIDDSDDMDDIYYFIAASDLNGQLYDIIIPQVNSVSVSLGSVPQGDLGIIIHPLPVLPVESVQGISNLEAVQERDRVVISFDTTGIPRNAILYRSMQPIRQPQDLLNAVIVQSGIDSPFIDFPIPGISWYYAVIFEDEIAGGNMGIIPGFNSTVSPIIISGDHAVERSLRPMPLPVLTLHNTLPGGVLITDIPDLVPLSAESINMLRETQMPEKAPLVLKSPRIFTVDMEAPAGGEESALFQIITEYFINAEWENVLVSLQHYLSLPRSGEVEARARFYLGQAMYFTGDYRGALMEFLAFRSSYPEEAGLWIDAVLSAMVY